MTASSIARPQRQVAMKDAWIVFSTSRGPVTIYHGAIPITTEAEISRLATAWIAEGILPSLKLAKVLL